MGYRSFTEETVRSTTRDWMSLADPTHKGAADPSTVISSDAFFDFCTNRQHVVRRLLECLAISEAAYDDARDIQEAVSTASDIALLEKGPSGGDEVRDCLVKVRGLIVYVHV